MFLLNYKLLILNTLKQKPIKTIKPETIFQISCYLNIPNQISKSEKAEKLKSRQNSN
jgi:hypothetical protein